MFDHLVHGKTQPFHYSLSRQIKDNGILLKGKHVHDDTLYFVLWYIFLKDFLRKIFLKDFRSVLSCYHASW